MKNILIALFLLFQAANAQEISSTFDIDSEDWLVVGDATSTIPLFVNEGGNDGGYISADDTGTGGVWYWLAPEKFLGNQSSSFGKNLTFDLKQSGNSAQFDIDDILISNGEITIAFDLENNPGTDWTSYSVSLDTLALWKLTSISGGELATSDQIMDVLSNISSIKIRGEYIDGPDTGGLDNVRLGYDLLAINEISEVRTILHPNPTTGIFTLSHVDDLIINKIEVIDLLGKATSIAESGNSQFDLSSFSSGVYILKFYSGDSVVQRKIIKY